MLAAIALPTYRSSAQLLGPDDAERIASATEERMSWHESANEPAQREYRRILKQELTPPQLLFEDGSGFVDRVAERVASSSLAESPFGKEILSSWVQEELKTTREPIQVPAKRALELEQAVTGGALVYPDGSGLLNFLFRAKNESEKSIDNYTFRRIYAAFSTITEGYTFNIVMLPNTSLVLYFRHPDGDWVKAADCGLGCQDLLILLYHILEPSDAILCIEEPESHLHPEMQRRLLSVMQNARDKQFFLTTHSNVFVNSTHVEKVFFTAFNGEVIVTDATSRAAILHDLGYSVAENLVSDLVILVEGPSDTPVLEVFLAKIGIPDRFAVRFWPLGGDIMGQLDLSVIAQSFKVVALIDQDPGSGKVRRDFEARCNEHGIEVFRLERYAIENYFSVRSLREVFNNQIDRSFVAIDPATKLADQIGFDVKRNNRKIAQAMTLDEISGTDLQRFLSRVEAICVASSRIV